jgi:hypothetical protein
MVKVPPELTCITGALLPLRPRSVTPSSSISVKPLSTVNIAPFVESCTITEASGSGFNALIVKLRDVVAFNVRGISCIGLAESSNKV